METAAAVAGRCGKEPSVLAKDIPGFIINRLGYAMYREALNLLELGVADVETIDRSFRNVLGVWSTICGPYQWIDLTGGPELYAKAMARVLPTLSTANQLPSALGRLVDNHGAGVTNGHGFMSTRPKNGNGRDKLFHAHAWQAYALMNEYFPLENK
jgi:3-hydroxybutyryl-CoA dehydrogenase